MAKRQFRRLAHLPLMIRLRKLWRRWNQVVTSLALKKHGHQNISDAEYRELYLVLLETCRKCACDYGAHMRPHFQRLEKLVEPWLSADAVRLAQRPILEDLLTQCRDVERTLNPHLKLQRFWQACQLAGLALGGGALMAWVLSRFGSGAATQMVERARLFVLRAFVAMKTADFLPKVAVGVVFLLVIGIWILVSVRRD